MLDRLVSIAAAVAGLGVYVVLVGGVRQGVKLEAAGLPVSVATHASTTADLTASGIRALFIWPAVFLVGVLIASLVERYESGDRYPALFRVAASALSVVFSFSSLSSASPLD